VGPVLVGRDPQRDLLGPLEDGHAPAVLEPKDELEAGVNRVPLGGEVHLFRLDRPMDERLTGLAEDADPEGALDVAVGIFRLDVVLVVQIGPGVGVGEFLFRQAADGRDDGIGGEGRAAGRGLAGQVAQGRAGEFPADVLDGFEGGGPVDGRAAADGSLDDELFRTLDGRRIEAEIADAIGLVEDQIEVARQAGLKVPLVEPQLQRPDLRLGRELRPLERLAEDDIEEAAVGLAAALGRVMAEILVGKAETLFVLLLELVRFRVGVRIAHPPKEADELVPVGVRLELVENGLLGLGQDRRDILEPEPKLGRELLGGGPGAARQQDREDEAGPRLLIQFGSSLTPVN